MPLCKQNGAVKLNESGTEGKPTIDLTVAVTLMKSVDTKQVWVQFQYNTLKMKNKCLVADGSRLTDKHMKFASYLSNDFSSISQNWWTAYSTPTN